MPDLLIFYKMDEVAQWSLDTVLHELAHALVWHARPGRRVESHGPEFVGAFCCLASEHYGISVDQLYRNAEEFGVRVEPCTSAQN